MTGDERLAAIYSDLVAAGMHCLIMGGHAVRYYGLLRNTIDFDLHLTPDRWDELPHCLAQLPVLRGYNVTEGNSWRQGAFRRFQIGRLPDGRGEWLEFWRHNHLLPPFAELAARHEKGIYGGQTLSFLSLEDLIRSKETERLHDWEDAARLEEFLDARRLARAHSRRQDAIETLIDLRSRSGFEAALQAGLLGDATLVRAALASTRRLITQAWLLPFAPDAPLNPTECAIEPVVEARLRVVSPASPLHLALVEIVRRQYRSNRQAIDRADKSATQIAATLAP